jgi:hypothetical protein
LIPIYGCNFNRRRHSVNRRRVFNIQKASGQWGIAILISGIVGLVGMSGFFIGPILAIIGGILAMARK